MDPKIAQFIIGSIKQQVPVEKIVEGLMQQFQMSQEDAQNAIEAVIQEVKSQQRGKEDEAKKGNSTPERVLAIFDELNIGPEEAIILTKEIFKLNQQGLKELLILLDRAMSQGGGKQEQQEAPQTEEQGPPEGMSQDPMENI